MKDFIVIPARYGSTRFPGKPLKHIAGRTLLERVVSVGMQAISRMNCVELIVATDHADILRHCEDLDVAAVLTDSTISSGSGRALAACKKMGVVPRYVVNLQGDAPFVSPTHVERILDKARSIGADVTTPVIKLSWAALDTLRERKQHTPFSGTTCVTNADGTALWFSKNIIPAIRNESQLRERDKLSPVYQHLGLYCYRFEVLEAFENSRESLYEQLEGLEQLRVMECGYRIDTVLVEPAAITMSGVDSPEDAERAEQLIEVHGDPFVEWK